MKKIRLLGIFIIVLAFLLISAPALAYGPPTFHDYSIGGIEIFAGIYSGGNTYGATFIPQASGTDGNGILRASINYKGEGPNGIAGYNDILGGNWTLTLTKGAVTGTIIGCIGSGTRIVWRADSKGNPTAFGDVILNLSIIGGTGGFSHIIRGSGSTFAGTDDHVNGPKLGSLTIPIVYGKLSLNYATP
jgi:hypothetical protein